VTLKGTPPGDRYT